MSKTTQHRYTILIDCKSHIIRNFALATLSLLLFSCDSGVGGNQILILVSIDGMRWDASQSAETPNLDSLARGGAQAEALNPSFPSSSIPNLYTIVTGLYPENHGIISDTMYDPVSNESFSFWGSEKADSRWWEGEPIWITAEKQKLKSAALSWPGSEAEISGTRPTYSTPSNLAMSPVERVQSILEWLRLPPEMRPTFLAMNFNLVEVQSQLYGPGSPEEIAAIQLVDSTIGILMAGIEQSGLYPFVNIMIVSDHGIAQIDSSNLIFLEDYVDIETAQVINWSPILGLRPLPGNINLVYKTLKGAHPQLQIYRRNEIPARLHYSNHHRIPPIIGIAEEGWSITTRDDHAKQAGQFMEGAHGYDNRLSSMAGIFIGFGPSFSKGVTVPAFSNIQLYNIMAKVLGIKPGRNDGNLESVRAVFTR